MSRRVSQSELAVLAGVSPATVSRALSGHPGISEQVTHRIRTIAKKLDYRPSAAARSFVTRQHNTLGLVICDRPLTSTVYAMLAAAVETSTRAVGLKLQLSSCESAEIEFDDLPPIFQDDGVDGVILTGSFPDWLLERMTTWSMPFVLMGTRPQTQGVSQVSGDAKQGGRLMVEYLLSKGHRELGLLLGPRSGVMHQQYFLGARDACLAVGMDDKQIENMVEECDNHDVIPPLERLLKRRPHLSAIFANTDQVAWETVQYLRAIGRRVPQDISVAGAGGGILTLPVGMKLTSVDVRLSEMGRTAVSLLQEMIKHPGSSARRIVIEPRVSIGSTVAAVEYANNM